MGARPGEDTESSAFSIPEIRDGGLSDQEAANLIGDFFARISQQHAPLDLDKLPLPVREAILTVNVKDIPPITPEQVKEVFASVAPSKGAVDGDIPTRLYLENIDILASPISHLFRTVATTGVWPSRWNVEHAFPLKKVPTPLSLDDLRAISVSPMLPAQFEKIVVDWLLVYIREQIDWAQYGGMKGCSVTHLLIEILTFIHYNLDLRSRQGIILTAVDYHKAFNKQDHGNFLAILHDMGVPGWLLHILRGFLSQRTMVMSFGEAHSDSKSMPGGGPAGTTLGLLMFIVLINKTATPGDKQAWGTLLSNPLRGRKPVILTHAKLVDDATIAEAVPLDRALVRRPESDWVRPVNFRSRFHCVLPPRKNRTIRELADIEEYAKNNYMEINSKKTKIVFFNPKRRNIDFFPEIPLKERLLEVVPHLRLVGVNLSDDFTWNKNTDTLIEKAYSKVWMLRRLKALGASRRSLLDIYYKHIRSILEFASPAWTGSLTRKESRRLERVQRVVLKIIFNSIKKPYRKLLEENKIQKLSKRRTQLALKFAKKAFAHEKFRSWFVLNNSNSGERASFKESITRTSRLNKSPIPFLTRLLNANNGH